MCSTARRAMLDTWSTAIWNAREAHKVTDPHPNRDTLKEHLLFATSYQHLSVDNIG